MKEENQTIIKAINMFGRVPEQYELLEEIERLNNIINEFEEWLENEIKFRKVVGKDFELRKVLNILQILKGSDKE